ncbi:hypothetical protein FCIRC_12073 [Fusarium circinatum]|uniref:Uncharacterized protein n=1 Tax=Fusarium circinatum TaxID=48490 RepID=A0A8H5SZR3_FUSCI|nr:hypothetical protein FCIRC_12073 [Fusarium circinatum]
MLQTQGTDEVFFTALAPPAVESIQLPVRQKRRNRKKTSMAKLRSKKNHESPGSSVGARGIKQESPGGNESEPVQAPVSGGDTKPVCLSLEKATASLQVVERKEHNEDSVKPDQPIL